MNTIARKYFSKTLKLTAVLILANGVSGCIVALPPAVQAASFALDGISFATTGKTVTDHALSAVAEQDCAMSRALNGEAICTKDAQLAELDALERRLNNPNAELVAKTVTPVNEDEDFKRATVELAEINGDDEVLDDDLQDLPEMNVANGPML